MIEGKDPVLQAFLGTLMTWGLTALGAAMAFFIRGNQVKSKVISSKTRLSMNYIYFEIISKFDLFAIILLYRENYWMQV